MNDAAAHCQAENDNRAVEILVKHLETMRVGVVGGTASRAASRLESDRWVLKNGAERGALPARAITATPL